MGMWAHQLLIFLPLLIAATAFAAIDDELQNPDFESPPSNIPSNSSTISFLPLNSSTNSIPGWSFQGSVEYVTNGPKISLPTENGHSIYLGMDGKINQTIKASEEHMHYLLTFILAAAAKNCSTDVDPATTGGVIVSFPDRSVTVSFKTTVGFGKDMWETHGVYLGSHGDGELLNLILENQSNNRVSSDESNSTTTCGPILDSLILKKIENPIKSTENNLLVNGGFEFGPAFPDNSTNGVLMDEAPSPTESPLLQWGIIGTVKYITSKDGYIVPVGNAAVEILTRGSPSGIQTAATLKKGSTYKMQFLVGDARDACVGQFVVGVQTGSISENFTITSRGTGSTSQYTITFKADSSVTPISFLSYKTTQAKDSVYCGPVIERVVLLPSYGLKLELSFMLLFSCLVFLVTIL